MKDRIIVCRDKFGNKLKENDLVDVQEDGIQVIYKKEDGQLYFKPYGEEDRVSNYFSNDMIKVNKDMSKTEEKGIVNGEEIYLTIDDSYSATVSVVETWSPTPELRYLLTTEKKHNIIQTSRVLQQLEVSNKGNENWVDVPTVKL